MSEGDTQVGAPALENAYSEFFQPETADSQPTEPAETTGDDEAGETEESPSETSAETPKAESAKTGWEERYKEANSLIGRQGNELGELRKELAQLKEQLGKQQQPQKDPFEKFPGLKALDPEKLDFALQTGAAALERSLADHGLTIEDLKQAKQLAEYTSQQMTQEHLNREIGELRTKYGEETFKKYLPALQQVANSHPTLSPREAWKLATADDLEKGQTERARAMEKERKDRAKSADFGNERPTKTSSRMSSEDIQKLSPNGSGKPSPRFKALYKEAMREMGG